MKKATQILAFVRRNCKLFKSPLLIKILYLSLIKPILMYGTIVWSPYSNYYKNRIQTIQQNFPEFFFLE